MLGIKVWNPRFNDKGHHKSAMGFRNKKYFGYN
jgi:hypothetical protein